MKLIDITSGEVIDLPNDMLWKDEFSWSPVEQAISYSLTGAVILDMSVKAAGRYIPATYPDSDMAWVSRATVEKLKTWAATAGRYMTLQLEYPTDTRSFKVMFRFADGALEAEPVKDFPEHEADAWFRVKINLIEVV